MVYFVSWVFVHSMLYVGFAVGSEETVTGKHSYPGFTHWWGICKHHYLVILTNITSNSKITLVISGNSR